MDVTKCSQCGLNNSSADASCERCGSSLRPTIPVEAAEFTHRAVEQPTTITRNLAPESSAITRPQILGIAGSFALFVGVFTPIISVPIVGSLNYFQNGQGDGVFVAALAVISIILTLARKYRGLLITGILSLGILAFTFINFQLRISQLRNQLQTDLAGNPFKGLGDAMLNTIQLQWGWAILLFGSALLIVAGVSRQHAIEGKPESASQPGFWNNRIVGTAIGLTLAITIVTYYFVHAANPVLPGTRGALPQKQSAEQRKPLLDALNVTLYEKGFEKADFRSGEYQDHITYKFSYTNNSSKDIKGFKGTIVAKDMFEDVIRQSELKEDQVIKAGQTVRVDRTLNYNQFMDADIKMRNTALENMKIEWIPDTIIFADGTVLRSSDQ